MKLIIDIGNTNTKIFIVENQNIVKFFIFSNENNFFNNNFIKEIMNFDINCCIISQVGNFINKNFINFIYKNYKVVNFTNKSKLPIKIDYLTPETLGLDRIAAAVGASVILPKTNVLIIDMGSAITYDILTKNNVYLGGNISPGIKMRFKSLNNFTKNLPLIEDFDKNFDKKLYGTTTFEAIFYGVINGVTNEIIGNINAFNNTFENLNVIFTGGDIFFFENLLKSCIFAEPNLIAFGLNKILELNA